MFHAPDCSGGVQFFLGFGYHVFALCSFSFFLFSRAMGEILGRLFYIDYFSSYDSFLYFFHRMVVFSPLFSRISLGNPSFGIAVGFAVCFRRIVLACCLSCPAFVL